MWKKLALFFILAMPGVTWAVLDTWIEVVDGAGVLVGHVTAVKVGGQGYLAPGAGWVEGLTTAFDPATGGELGTFRFVADMAIATRPHRVYFGGPGCPVAPGAIFFVVDDNPAPGDLINAEGRAALHLGAEWATIPLPVGPLPAAGSYMDPFGPCLPNPLGVLPGGPSDYRMGVGISRAYGPPFSVI